MNAEEEKARTARLGRPRELDREKVMEAVVAVLSKRKDCWHRDGPHRGRPNATALHRRLLLRHGSLLVKEDGEPVTKKWLRDLLGEISEEKLEALRQEAGIGAGR